MSTDTTFKEFQELALRTESKVSSANMDVDSVKTLLRMFIATGNLLDFTKKGVFYNNYTKYDDNFVEIAGMMNDSVLELVMGHGERSEKADLNFRIFHGLLGAITEASEIAMILLKYLETGEIDKANIAEEFSDSD
jgi:hypothetical protein